MEPRVSSAPPFGTQLIGQTEKTLNAILGRLLAGTEVSEPQWVTLTVAVMGDRSLPPDEFATRLAGALRVTTEEARARIDELTVAQLLGPLEAGDQSVSVTEAGRVLHASVRARVAEITERLWGDLPRG
jgi:hypothetical protein